MAITRQDRFWAKVDKASDDECWHWTGAKTQWGYGLFWNGTNKLAAHRYSYEIHTGIIGDGKVICHSCDTRSCVNPNHLFEGTQYDNMHDMIAKGRKVVALGEQRKSKLTTEQVIEIRSLTGIPQSEIAKLYGISQSNVSQIKNNKRWDHLNGYN